MQVEEACSLHEKDGIYVNVQEDNRIAFVTCHYCPRLKIKLHSLRNIDSNIDFLTSDFNCFFDNYLVIVNKLLKIRRLH